MTCGLDAEKDPAKESQAINWVRTMDRGKPVYLAKGARNTMRQRAKDYHTMTKSLWNGDDYEYRLDIYRKLELKVNKEMYLNGNAGEDVTNNQYDDVYAKYHQRYPDAFKYDYKLFLKQLCQTMTDGAGSMFGQHKGFQALLGRDQVKLLNLPQAYKKDTHGFNHLMELGKGWRKRELNKKRKELRKRKKLLQGTAMYRQQIQREQQQREQQQQQPGSAQSDDDNVDDSGSDDGDGDGNLDENMDEVKDDLKSNDNENVAVSNINNLGLNFDVEDDEESEDEISNSSVCAVFLFCFIFILQYECLCIISVCLYLFLFLFLFGC